MSPSKLQTRRLVERGEQLTPGMNQKGGGEKTNDAQRGGPPPPPRGGFVLFFWGLEKKKKKKKKKKNPKKAKAQNTGRKNSPDREPKKILDVPLFKNWGRQRGKPCICGWEKKGARRTGGRQEFLLAQTERAGSGFLIRRTGL